MTLQSGPPAGGRPILDALKRRGPATTHELSGALGVSYEAVRQQLQTLIDGGWIAAAAAGAASGRGRRAQRYALSEAGDHLFPKHYDALSAELVETLADVHGPKAVAALLRTMTERRVARWKPLLEGLPLKRRLAALRGLYEADDAYMSVTWKGRTPRLVERNCPFLNVARRHPALCSVSVWTLSRLLGVRVVREQRFQNGDGCCVFRVCVDEPIRAGAPFELEPELEPEAA